MAAYLKNPFTYNPLIARKPLIRVKYYCRPMMMSHASLNVSPILEFSDLLGGTAASEQVNGG